MFSQVWLIPAFPFLGFILLILIGSRLSKGAIASVGVGSIGLSAVAAITAGLEFVISLARQNSYVFNLWTWMEVAGFKPAVSLYVDALSVTMIVVVTTVGFFIHLYSAEYMREEEGYAKFFAYMNLFVGFMLLLVLADNMLLLYLGWEGVGICSYLLIGFWYKNAENGRAAIKAFVVTRIGDTALAIGIFLIFTNLGTLQIQEIMGRAASQWPEGSAMAIVAAALILGGALGKSAQLPLQTWLPDAMAGPTPVSALIHAATMVTAGVYLIARMNLLFILAPPVQAAVAIIGTITLLVAGFSALAQTDIKRVLAYSTISQIGYMFLALGVGAWSAAIFHFMTHAFFKSLLFLSAGVIITALHHEQNIFKMGGLRTRLPVAFWTFLIGGASLAAMPLVTGGFYSKDAILMLTWTSEQGSPWLWLGGVLGALITSMYIFRVIFLVFFGQQKSSVNRKPGWSIVIPLTVLAVLSVISGFLETPQTLGHVKLFSNFLQTALPAPDTGELKLGVEVFFEAYMSAVSIFGVFLAYVFFLRGSASTDLLMNRPISVVMRDYWFSGFGFDWFYDKVFIRPFLWLSSINRRDFIDLVYEGIASLARIANTLLSETQTGFLRHYALGMAIGAVLVVAIMVFL
jgi:NADH-quinone oxidoreductase subunit L